MGKFDDIVRWAEGRGEEMSLTVSLAPHSRDRWVAGLHVGREAEDSDMVAAASYGMGNTPDEALDTLMQEFRITGVAAGGAADYPKLDRSP